jgi:hypothetical protein
MDRTDCALSNSTQSFILDMSIRFLEETLKVLKKHAEYFHEDVRLQAMIAFMSKYTLLSCFDILLLPGACRELCNNHKRPL